MSVPDVFRVQRLVSYALECSVYVDPDNPGLSNEELFEVAKRLGLREGEVGDTFKFNRFGLVGNRFIPGEQGAPAGWGTSGILDDSGCLNLDAFKHIRNELNEAARSFGGANARLRRDLIIARGEHKGIAAHDIKVALVVQTLTGMLIEKNNEISFRHQPIGGFNDDSPSRHPRREKSSEKGSDVLEIVRDVMRRRDGQLPLSIEPLDGFAERLSWPWVWTI